MKRRSLIAIIAIFIVLFSTQSCKKNTDGIPSNTPIITGIWYMIPNSNFADTLGTPNIKLGVVHPGGNNTFVHRLLNPYSLSFFVGYQIYENANVDIKIEAAYFPGHVDTMKVANTSLFGRGAILERSNYVSNPNYSYAQDFLTDSLPNGFYKVTALIQTSVYTDTLYDNLWIAK